MEADEEFLLRKRLCQLEGNPLDPLEEFLRTPIGHTLPAVTRLVASKLVGQETPEQISRALGISIETVNGYIKEIIRALHCHKPPDPLVGCFTPEQPKRDDLMSRAVEVAPSDGEASQRAKVLRYLHSPASGKLSADARNQLRMWAEGTSQREVGRKLGVDQGNLSRRIKAALNEAYRVESAAAQLDKEMEEARQGEALENQRREQVLRKAVAAGDRKQIKALLSRHPRHNDAMHRATTGGKSHERLAIDPDDLPSRKVGPAGHGPDR